MHNFFRMLCNPGVKKMSDFEREHIATQFEDVTSINIEIRNSTFY